MREVRAAAMRWITVAILILLLALVLRMELLAYAMYVFLAILVLSRGMSQAWARSVTAQRECNRLTAEVGDTVAVVVTLENTGRLPIAWLLAEDLLPRRALMFRPPNLQLRGNRLQLQMIRPHGRKSLRYQLVCNRRGYYQLGPLVAETGDLFGLHRRFRVVTEPHFLMVYPPVMPLAGFELASRRPIGEVRMTYRLYEDPTRIAGVRAYQPGDPLNRVHWRATARTVLVEDYRLLDEHLEERVVLRPVDLGDEALTESRRGEVDCIGHEGHSRLVDWYAYKGRREKSAIALVRRRVTGCCESVTFYVVHHISWPAPETSDGNMLKSCASCLCD